MHHLFKPVLGLLIVLSAHSSLALAEVDGGSGTGQDEALDMVGMEPANAAGNVAVHIAGLESASGNVFFAVYDSEDTWLSEDTVLEKKVSIEESRQEGLVQTHLDLAPGQYAMTVFYDRDDDGELDTNFIGMPKEPIALSNNAKASFGPPKFADAAFDVGAEPLLQTINMEEL